MVDADIPGIAALGGEKSILKVRIPPPHPSQGLFACVLTPTHAQVQEKFMLDLTDEQAIKEFQDLIQSSVGNVWAPIFDNAHDLAQKFK